MQNRMLICYIPVEFSIRYLYIMLTTVITTTILQYRKRLLSIIFVYLTMKTLSTIIQFIVTLHVIEFCALIQKLSKKINICAYIQHAYLLIERAEWVIR